MKSQVRRNWNMKLDWKKTNVVSVSFLPNCMLSVSVFTATLTAFLYSSFLLFLSAFLLSWWGFFCHICTPLTPHLCSSSSFFLISLTFSFIYSLSPPLFDILNFFNFPLHVSLSPSWTLCLSHNPLGLNFFCPDSDLSCLPSTLSPSLVFCPSCLPVSSNFPHVSLVRRHRVFCHLCLCVWIFVFGCVCVCGFVLSLTARPLGQPILEAAAQSQQPQSDSPAPGRVAPTHPTTCTDAARRRCSW